MLLKRWDKLPLYMQTEEVKKYYDVLKKKGFLLFLKRLFDISVSFVLLIIFLPVFLIVGIAIKIDSKGPVFYRQERVTVNGERFKIFKLRTMFVGGDAAGHLTVGEDGRITKVGRFIRKIHLDEIAQFIDVLRGKMTLVGARPEVPEYVEKYTDRMKATLLLPAGVTSVASIKFKDENLILAAAENPEEVYVNQIMPQKAEYNLQAIEKFGLFSDMGILIKTFFSVFKKSRKTENTDTVERDGKADI